MKPRTKNSVYATTYHISRILLFLRENSDAYFTIKVISEKCCISKDHTSNALKFLIKEKFVNEFNMGSLKVFALNTKQDMGKKIKKDLSKINYGYRKKKK